ncbi:MAG TPA: MFS transporter [Polyangiaceae bacterium]
MQPLCAFTVCTFYLLPKFLTSEFSASPSQVGWVSTAYGGASIVALPILGVAIDRSSARRLMLVSSLVLVGSALGFVWVEAFGPLVLILRFAQGVAWALSFTAGMMLTTTLAPPERLSQAIGYYGSSNLVMNALAPAVAETLAEHFGWKVSFLAAAVTSAFAWFIARGLPKAQPAPPIVTSLWSLLGRQSSWWMVVIVAIWGSAFGAMLTFCQPFAMALGIQRVRGFFIAYTAAALFARLATGGLPDRIGRYRVSVGSLALYAAVVFATQGLRPGWLEPLGLFFGLAHGLFFPAFSALTLERVTVAEQGKLTALSNGAFNLGFAASGAVLGPIAEHVGYPRVFTVAGLATFAGVAILPLTPFKRSKLPPEALDPI